METMDVTKKIKSLYPAEFSQICRICLSYEDLRLIPETLIENIEAIDLLEYTIGVRFDKNESLPSNICGKCLSTVFNMYKLKKQCLINERLFRIQLDTFHNPQKESANIQDISEAAPTKTEQETILGETRKRVMSLADQSEPIRIKMEPIDDEYSPKDTEENANACQDMSSTNSFNIKMETEQQGLTTPNPDSHMNFALNAASVSRDQSYVNDLQVVPHRITGTCIKLEEHHENFKSDQGMDDAKHWEEANDNKPASPGHKISTEGANSTCTTSTRQLLSFEGEHEMKSPVLNVELIEGPVAERKTNKWRANTKIPCAVCEKMIGCRGMGSHLLTHEPERKTFECDFCHRQFKTKSILRIHKMNHTGQHPYKCPTCEKGYTTFVNFENHTRTCSRGSEPTEFPCKICGKVLFRRHTFRRHIRGHISRNEAQEEDMSEAAKYCTFTCDQCSQLFETQHNLMTHIKRTHSGLSFLCNVCGKNLASERALMKHMKIHTGEKPFSCEICQQSYTNRGNLRSHMFTHTEERPFKCSLCLKRFKNATALNNHLILHNGEKPFTCKYCEKSFAIKGNLSKHIATHTGEKRHFCSICKKGFYDKNMMRSHEARHKATEKKDSDTEPEDGV